ncbi:MAG TPA: DEAD/DEAH box helicase family protein [Solirubrobacterales bacterium]|nr:DEAD/DEAH box helicase family protein [Solirubrobacterales bacterium]
MRVETFAERVLRRPLWPHQLEAANTATFITIIAAARRTGKTSLAETLAIWTAFSNRGCRVLILSATAEAARRLTESIGETLASHAETRGAVVDDFATRIRLGNGSQIISLPASQKQVRGYGKGVLLLILDEAGFQADEMWQAALYTAMDEKANGSRIVLCGTPWGDGFFRREFVAGLDGDPDHASFNWTHQVNPELDHAYLERQRDRVSPIEYAAEIEGKWSDVSGSLFSTELIEAQTAPVEVPTLAELAGAAARPSLGVDWGVSFDRSAAVAVYRLPGVDRLNAGSDERPAKFIALPYVWPVGARLSGVVDDIAGLPAAWWNPETSGVGAGPAQLLQERVRARGRKDQKRWWNFVATTAAKKTAGYGQILSLAERGQLFWPNDPSLLRQLRGLRIEQGSRGFAKIEAEDAVTHDDVADALMLAMAPRVLKRKRIVCQVGTAANPRNATPDVELPEDGGEVVEAGSGFRLYRRPPLQSVAGRGLWMPPTAATAQTVIAESPQVREARELIAERGEA